MIFKRVILIILVFLSLSTAQVPVNHQVNNFLAVWGSTESSGIIPKRGRPIYSLVLSPDGVGLGLLQTKSNGIIQKRDSLKINFPDTLHILPVTKHTVEWNKQRIIGIGLMVVFGMLSYHFHCEAEESYNAYLRSGSYSEMDRLFARTKQYDQYAGFSYVGLEIGFIFTSFSFIKKLP